MEVKKINKNSKHEKEKINYQILTTKQIDWN